MQAERTDGATVEELREVLAYVRTFKPAAGPPALLDDEQRPFAYYSIRVSVHQVERAVLRELVADDPDAWEVDVVADGLHERYFRASLKTRADRCQMHIYTLREPVEDALL